MGSCFSIYDSSQAVWALYPICGQPGSTIDTLVIVQATFGSGRPKQIKASLSMSFGMALWMTLFLHLVGVEIYLNLTPRESSRIRKVSIVRQMERGLQPFGSSGLTTDRWGDAEPWKPSEELTMTRAGRTWDPGKRKAE